MDDIVNITVNETIEVVSITIDETNDLISLEITENNETVDLTIEEVGVKGDPGNLGDIDGGTP